MKKPRRVIVTLELETALPLTVLKNRWVWRIQGLEAKEILNVLQAQANVAKSAKLPKKAKK